MCYFIISDLFIKTLVLFPWGFFSIITASSDTTLLIKIKLIREADECHVIPDLGN